MGMLKRKRGANTVLRVSGREEGACLTERNIIINSCTVSKDGSGWGDADQGIRADERAANCTIESRTNSQFRVAVQVRHPERDC